MSNSSNNNEQALDLTASLPVATGDLAMEDRVGQVNAPKAEELENQMEQDYDDGSTTVYRVHTFSAERKHIAPGKGLGIPKIKEPVTPGIPSQPIEASAITDVKPEKKIDSFDIPASSRK
ncbi:hypothetical protein Tco_0444517 [Tanacetum coccineum]